MGTLLVRLFNPCEVAFHEVLAGEVPFDHPALKSVYGSILDVDALT